MNSLLIEGLTNINLFMISGIYYYLLCIHITCLLHCFLSQRDIVAAHVDAGSSLDEQGVEDAFELLHEVSERVRTGIWVGDCFIYNNSAWRLNYCVGGEVSMVNFPWCQHGYFLCKCNSLKILFWCSISDYNHVPSGSTNVPAWVSCKS